MCRGQVWGWQDLGVGGAVRRAHPKQEASARSRMGQGYSACGSRSHSTVTAADLCGALQTPCLVCGVEQRQPTVSAGSSCTLAWLCRAQQSLVCMGMLTDCKPNQLRL